MYPEHPDICFDDIFPDLSEEDFCEILDEKNSWQDEFPDDETF